MTVCFFIFHLVNMVYGIFGHMRTRTTLMTHLFWNTVDFFRNRNLKQNALLATRNKNVKDANKDIDPYFMFEVIKVKDINEKSQNRNKINNEICIIFVRTTNCFKLC